MPGRLIYTVQMRKPVGCYSHSLLLNAHSTMCSTLVMALHNRLTCPLHNTVSYFIMPESTRYHSDAANLLSVVA